MASTNSARFERFDRPDLIDKWDDSGFRKEVIDRSEDKSNEAFTVGEVLENHSPASPENPSTAVDHILYKRGFNLYDNEFQISSRMNAFGANWQQQDYNKREDRLSDLVLVDSHLDMAYWKSLISGTKTTGMGVSESLFKNLNQLGGISSGSVLNPKFEATFIRAKLFGPSIDFRRIVGDIEYITEENYNLNKDNNKDDERAMEEYPEGVVPKIMTLEYSEENLTFKRFRGGIRATYDYLNSNQTRVSRIRNAIEEIAIYHRIKLFEMIVKAIKDALPSGNIGSAKALNWTNWRDFVKGFGSMYSADVMLCKTAESTKWENMSVFNTTSGLATISQLIATNPQFVSNPYILNNNPVIPEYGWYDGAGAGLQDNKYLTFDRDRSSKLVFQRGSDQDETVREAGPQVITRYLSTKAGAFVPDANGIREYTST